MHPTLFLLPLLPTALSYNPSYPPSSHGYSPLSVRQGMNDDCLLNNELNWNLDCKGFNEAPRDSNNEPITDCNKCSCDNNCKVIGCDGLKDWDGTLCSKGCGCSPNCGDNDPGCLLGGTKGGSGGPPPSGDGGEAK